MAFGVLAGLAATAAALMTYSVTVVLLFCGLAACATWFAIPASRVRVITVCLSALASFLGSHVLLWLATGYDPVQMFLTAVANSNHIMSGTRHESVTRYIHLVVGNLVVFFIAAGLPCTAIWWAEVPWLVRGVWHGQPGHHFHPWLDVSLQLTNDEALGTTSSPSEKEGMSSRTVFAMTSCLTLLVAAIVPVYVLEVERVWMFLTPLVAIPVAGQLFDRERSSGKIGVALAVTILLAVQTLLTEVLLTTYW